MKTITILAFIALVICAIAEVSCASPVCAASARSSDQLTLSRSSTSVTLSRTVTFSGVLRTAAGAPIENAAVYLHISTDETNWLAISITSTSAKGAYSFSSPITNIDTSADYFRTSYGGSAQYACVFSPTVAVTVTSNPQTRIVCVGDSLTKGIGNGT